MLKLIHMATLLGLLFLSVHARAEGTALASVERFDNHYIGYAGEPSPNYEAFAAELARGAEAAPLFERLLTEGKPGARLYAALGLYALDKERGRAALQALRADPTPVESMSGCMIDTTTVGKLAAELLRNDGAAIAVYLPGERARK